MAPLKSAIYRWLAPEGPEISVVFTPYKTGSTTMFDRLSKPRFCAGGHGHSHVDIAAPRNLAHFAIKCHSGNRNLGMLRKQLDRPIRRIITLLRPQKEIYVSAFFQNISDTGYSYSYGSRAEVLNASVDDLVDHFMNIPWEIFRHLQISENAREIENYCGVNYFDALPLNHELGFAILPGHFGGDETMIAVADVRVLDDITKFKRFWRRLELPWLMRCQPISFVDSNTSRAKWYSEKYTAFRNSAAIIDYLAESGL